MAYENFVVIGSLNDILVNRINEWIPFVCGRNIVQGKIPSEVVEVESGKKSKRLAVYYNG